MSENSKNYYKMCRDNAGIIQEYAAGALGVSIRTLSDYENDKSPVPDDIVYRMCEIYDTKFLALWHLKKSKLGRFLPEIYEPDSLGDMMFSLALAKDATDESYTAIREVYRDRMLTEAEIPQLRAALAKAKEANTNLTAIIMYAETNIKELNENEDWQISDCPLHKHM